MLIKGLVGLVVIMLAAVIMIPKPQLISYQAADQISQGVYWPGITSSGRFLDSNADFVKIDATTNNLHLCYRFEQGDSCQQYEIIQSHGLFETIIFMFNNKLL